MLIALASPYHGAYHGPAELTPARALTSWTIDVPVLLAVLLAGSLYLASRRRVVLSGGSWPAARTLSFCAGGLGALVIATMSFLGVYQGTLFYVRAAQTIVLLLVAPLFLVLGRPLTLMAAASSAAGERLRAALGARAARVLTFPALTALVLVVVPFLLYFTGWYEAGLRNGAVRELTYLALLAPGLVFFWTLLRVDPVPKSYPYAVSLWVSGIEVVGDAILGLAVIADPHLIAGAHYRALARPWGPGLHADQVIGGGILWILGDIVGVPFFAAQLIQMIKEDEQEAERIDAELDAAGTVPDTTGPALAAAGGGAPVGSGTTGASGVDGAGAPQGAGRAPGAEQGGGTAGGAAQRPWWESDPRLAGRFRPPGQRS